MNNLFAQIMIQAASGYMTTELVKLLHKFRENNDEQQYQELKAAIQNSFTLLKRITDSSKTKVDDIPVKIILDAIDQAD